MEDLCSLWASIPFTSRRTLTLTALPPPPQLLPLLARAMRVFANSLVVHAGQETIPKTFDIPSHYSAYIYLAIFAFPVPRVALYIFSVFFPSSETFLRLPSFLPLPSLYSSSSLLSASLCFLKQSEKEKKKVIVTWRRRIGGGG